MVQVLKISELGTPIDDLESGNNGYPVINLKCNPTCPYHEMMHDNSRYCSVCTAKFDCLAFDARSMFRLVDVETVKPSNYKFVL